MQQFKDLVIDILVNGFDKDDRTGIGSRSVFGRTITFDLNDGFPALTLRRAPFRIAFEETMFFLRGETNTKLLEEKKINIWKGNTSREFLDSRGLNHLPEGDMGKGYSYQWRNFFGVDQIKELCEGLKKDPLSRRHLVTAWNPAQTHEMALPPCHLLHQYQVENDKLNSLFFMRSNDVIFGLPFNIMGYALLNHLFAAHVGLKPGKLVYMGGDVHIYQNQMDMAKELIKRDPKPLPTLEILKDVTNFDDLLSLQFTDVKLHNYDPHPDITNKPSMAI